MPKTVLLTGATGFIAKHIAVRLLNAGYQVRGTLRSPARADEVRDAVRPHLKDAKGLDTCLTFTALDLTRDAGWDAAMAGVDAVIHTASPFPLGQPKNEDDLIRPTMDGALRALRAAHAAGVARVVMTSSSVAVLGTDLPPGHEAYDEASWTDPYRAGTIAYARSKTLAERAAWDFVETEAPEMRLTTINPVFVLGAPLDAQYGTSLKVIERVLRGKDPMLPRIAFPIVDVRDVAEAHVRALDRPETEGKRVLAADSTLWFSELAGVLKAAYPDRRMPTRTAPDMLIRFLALFDPAIRSIVPTLGHFEKVSNARARDLLEMEFIPAREAVRAAGAWLIENGRV
jgi:dihydroflavonol-4-reductase